MSNATVAPYLGGGASPVAMTLLQDLPATVQNGVTTTIKHWISGNLRVIEITLNGTATANTSWQRPLMIATGATNYRQILIKSGNIPSTAGGSVRLFDTFAEMTIINAEVYPTVVYKFVVIG
jgi:chorismate-pyruvate lyase